MRADIVTCPSVPGKPTAVSDTPADSFWRPAPPWGPGTAPARGVPNDPGSTPEQAFAQFLDIVAQLRRGFELQFPSALVHFLFQLADTLANLFR
jgi:hypothetical protein